MLNLKIKYKCELCNKFANYYVMPFDKKTVSGDRVHSNNHFRLTCKSCGQNYSLRVNIEAI